MDLHLDIQTLSILAIVGIVSGFLASTFARGYGLGLIGNMFAGAIGALIAAWFVPHFVHGFELVSPLVTAVAYAASGALIVLLLVGLLGRAD